MINKLHNNLLPLKHLVFWTRHFFKTNGRTFEHKGKTYLGIVYTNEGSAFAYSMEGDPGMVYTHMLGKSMDAKNVDPIFIVDLR